ncbi:unnamed protein product [Adineta steineri]|uniref:HPP transmembrane region domain-containing protein n=1 Tax=Adineta steineri TaxID=433720 RepID=A0A819JQT4_9BILA|nr:unnamed protein product [Adineta steineri]CAF3931519.1 unnamed protein product [Adineta steineri]
MATTASGEISTISGNNRTETRSGTDTPEYPYQWLRSYFLKWTGKHAASPPKVILSDCIIAFVGTFISISILAFIHYRLLDKHDLVFFIASFGASAMILYAAPSTPVAQPRNIVGGQVIGAFVGCTIRLILGTNGETFLALALAVALSLFLMQITGTMHAPAGATALIAIMPIKPFPWGGFQFILMPVLSGSFILLFIAVIVNNIGSNRHYPCYWW